MEVLEASTSSHGCRRLLTQTEHFTTLMEVCTTPMEATTASMESHTSFHGRDSKIF